MKKIALKYWSILIFPLIFLGFSNGIKAQNWEPLGPNDFNQVSYSSTKYTAIALDDFGLPYIVFSDYGNSGKATVKHYNGSTWEKLGPEGFSNDRADYTSIALNSNNTPYVVYSDKSDSYKAVVKRYNGNSWEVLGNSPISDDAANYTSICIDASDIPYIVYQDAFNDFKATVQRFNGTNWEPVGQLGFSSGNVGRISMAIDNDGTPYVFYVDFSNSSKATVQRYNGSTWEIVGDAGFSEGGINLGNINIDSSGQPYVAYLDNVNATGATVQRFNGSDWELVGNAGFSGGLSLNPRIAFDNSDKPYIVFSDGVNSNKATVQHFNGTTWEILGTAGISSSLALYTSIVLDESGNPYIIYTDDGLANKAIVRRFNNNSWEFVGEVGFSLGISNYNSMAIDNSGTPYVFYKDGRSGQATVQQYNGSSWEVVGERGFTGNGINASSIAINNSDTPFVIYSDAGNSYKVNVELYNGTSWESVGQKGISIGQVNYSSIALNASNTPYVLYSDLGNSGKATVKRYNGTSWEFVGNADISSGKADYTSLALNSSGVPYVVYVDIANNSAVTVKRYNGNSWENVGEIGFSEAQAKYTSIKFDNANTPYVVYQDAARDLKATVERFNGVAWETVGAAGFSSGRIGFPSIAFDNSNTPYILYSDSDFGSKATVQKFNGTAWEPLGEIGFSAGTISYTAMAFDGTNKLIANYGSPDSFAKQFILQPQGCLSLASPWTSTDIGAVGATGSACLDQGNGTFEIEGSGADIWNNADEFHYVYQPLNGDGEIVARLVSQENTFDWAKSGIMMRNSLDPGSPFAHMLIAPNPYDFGVSYAFQDRPVQGSYLNGANNVGPTPIDGYPYYLRLVREGNTFSGYVSQTNGNWQLVGSKSITMDETILVGLAVTSHNDGVLNKSIFDNVEVKSEVVADNEAPIITLLGDNPLELSVGDTYNEPGATAIDNVDGDISNLIDIDASAVDTSFAGLYTVTYNVDDAADNPAIEVVRVVNVVEAPEVTAPLINEFTSRYLEIYGDSNTDYSDYTLLGVSSSTSYFPDTTPWGRITQIHQLGVTDSNGYWLTTSPSIIISFGYASSFLLVKDFNGSVGEYLDLSRNGEIDNVLWDSIADDVSLLGPNTFPFVLYSSTVLRAVRIDPNFLLSLADGFSRIPNGVDTDSRTDWIFNYEINGALDTPGGPNLLAPPCAEIPSPWVNADIGAVGAAGDACFDAATGTFEVEASGANIWNLADEFHYVYQELLGDGEIVARVVSQENTFDWTKAGVMMRNGTDPDAEFALMTMLPNPAGSGPAYAFQYRDVRGEYLDGSNNLGLAFVDGYPYFVRLVREGNTITGYASATNGNWQFVGSAAIAMEETILVGLAVTSHNDGVLNKSVFDNVEVKSEVVADNEAPIITILGDNPLELSVGDTYNEPGATAIDNVDGDISNLIDIDASAVDTAAAGLYTITYNVDDAAGNSATEVVRTVNVIGQNPTITEPLINEFAPEYIEIYGDANTDYSDYTILLISSYTADVNGSGRIYDKYDVGSTNSDGYWVTTNYDDTSFLNNAKTYLLVKDFTGVLGDYIDVNKDFVIDGNLWTILVDDVGYFVDVGADYSVGYTTSILRRRLPSTPTLPLNLALGYSRIPNGIDTNSSNDWAPMGFPEIGKALNTPGTANELITELNVCNPVPSPWTSADIGDVGATGTACLDVATGTFEVEGSGFDIWNLADEFHYVYQSLNGDGEIIARVVSQTNTFDWAKAGVMMRNGTDADAEFALMTMLPNPGNLGQSRAFQFRDQRNVYLAGANNLGLAPVGNLPHYVRLVRQGSTFIGYSSTTNGNWQLVGSATIAMDQQILVGLAVSSHNDGVLSKAVFDQVSVNPIGIPLQANLNGMHLYPNPATEAVQLEFDEPTQVQEFQVFDLLGRLVRTIKVDPRDAQHSMTVLELPAGTYFVKTTDAKGQRFQQQMVIKR